MVVRLLWTVYASHGFPTHTSMLFWSQLLQASPSVEFRCWLRTAAALFVSHVCGPPCCCCAFACAIQESFNHFVSCKSKC